MTLNSGNTSFNINKFGLLFEITKNYENYLFFVKVTFRKKLISPSIFKIEGSSSTSFDRDRLLYPLQSTNITI